MPRDNREVQAILQNKFAFTLAKKATDHRWLELALPNSPRIITKFSHTREDIGKTLWKLIANQLHVQSNYLDGMIDCTNSRDDYYKKVQSAPSPSWSHSTRVTAKPIKHKPHRKK